MSTATAIRNTTKRTHPERHFKWVGYTRMVCIQPGCDGVHHTYCSCHAH